MLPVRKSKRAESRTSNPLRTGIQEFLSEHRSSISAPIPDESDLPKRYTRYGSLLLLGPTFMSHSPAWSRLYHSLNVEQSMLLFRHILNGFPGCPTHIAANAPISAHVTPVLSGASGPASRIENFMRSPVGLLPLHGEFGPDCLIENASSPSQRDFETAFWTETTQLQDITQVWAPRWTMFSRGNISEKARILQEQKGCSPFPGLSSADLADGVSQTDTVDFYVGIGYFAFCYLFRGVHRVWGWDINGWSIEGLRRGCVRNGWGVKVVRIIDDGHFEDVDGAVGLVREIQQYAGTPQAIRCVAFWGDNRWAGKVLKEIDVALRATGTHDGLNVRHCNLGLLPTSQRSWTEALSVLNPAASGWLHVHENVDATQTQEKAREVVQYLEKSLQARGRNGYSVTCEHVEKVKTYAPGVMHCVFDIKIYGS